MKNTLWEIGGWRMTEPELVVKLGFILDNYKISWLPRLWREAEAEAITRLPLFVKEDLFFQEEIAKGELVYSFRYYTPLSNRRLITEIEGEKLI